MLATCVPRKVTCLLTLSLTSDLLAGHQLGPPTDSPSFPVHRLAAGGEGLDGSVPWSVPVGPLGSLGWVEAMTQSWQGRAYRACPMQLLLLTAQHLPHGLAQ